MHNEVQSTLYNDIDTLFFDAGGTLVSIDFAQVCKELSRFGVHCSFEQLQRAEAAARPIVSEKLAELEPGAGEGLDLFEFFLRTILGRLSMKVVDASIRIPTISKQLAPILRPGGRSNQLWSYVLPGVRESLRDFAAMGLKMVVVSNSDGTVEQLMHESGLRHFFDAVVDSHVVGYAKPDPRIFRHALDISGSDASRTLHVGDMYYADIVGAESAGIRAVLLDPFGDWIGYNCPRLPDLPALHREMARARG
jgi:HAD superfamily hydrolase (TIGR01509 family)